MIEISKTNLRQQARAGGKSRKKSAVDSVSSTFSSELNMTIETDYYGSIEELLGDLKDQEKRFLDQQSHYELERYKAMVKKILKMILEKGFENRLLDLTARDKRLGRAEKSIIEKIDDNLIKLSQMVTRSSDAFNFLKTIEEIRGLIFDLVY
jgi:uncharacterized protein YaaR (DUF327 family)